MSKTEGIGPLGGRPIDSNDVFGAGAVDPKQADARINAGVRLLLNDIVNLDSTMPDPTPDAARK